MHTHTHSHTLLYTGLWSQCVCVCLIFSLAPLPNGEHSWHPEARRGLDPGSKQRHTSELAPCYQPSIPLFLLSGPQWATHPPLFSEGSFRGEWPLWDMSRSFERRFSSHSVSQRCVFIWISAWVPIQECELAEDIIKEMYVLICGVTFKWPCSVCFLRSF